MPKNKAVTPQQTELPIKWEEDVADHDYAAAQAYLSLKLIARGDGKGGGSPAQGQADHAPGQRHLARLRASIRRRSMTRGSSRT